METEKLYKEKGQIGGAVGAITGLVAGMGVAVLVLIFMGSLGGQTYNLVEPDILTIGNHTVTNEPFTILNSTAVSLANNNIQKNTISFLWYDKATIITADNFTVTTATGTVQLVTPLNASFNNSVGYASYNWGDATSDNIRAHVQGGILSSFEALEQTGNYMPIIVLAVVIALVLSLVLGMTMIGGVGGGRSAL